MSENDVNEYAAKLEALRVEHKDLDDVIDRLSQDVGIDDLQLRRMKKRRLHIKDQILFLESK